MKNPIQQDTLHWVRDTVVRLRLCPFAAAPLAQDRVACTVCPEAEHEAAFYWAGTQVQALLETERSVTETTLLVFPEGLGDFSEFMGFVGALEEFLADSGADYYLQLAHFHPDYVFADADADDPANATNRSPYPTVQLLRTQSVSEAVAGYGDTARIHERNVALYRGKLSE
jgi:hypothetical protein